MTPVALVTGVSRLQGIGRAICLDLAKRGFDIFFTSWTTYDLSMPWGIEPAEPQTIQDEILALGVRCASCELDLAKEGAPATLLHEVTEALDAPSVLVNNATYSTKMSLDDFSMEEFDRHCQLNLRATTELTLRFIEQFVSGKGGRVINITSGQSLGEMSQEIAYAITKGAIETLTKTISQDAMARGITINAVNPGPNDTGWIEPEFGEELKARFPTGRLGTPEDTAKLVGFLCSEDAAWITGQVIHSEGGFRRG